MNENALRTKVVDQARSWIGRCERDGSHREIVDVYNTIRPLPVGYTLRYTDAWCAGFVSAVAKICGLTDVIFPECSCSRMLALYKAAGRWVEDDSYVPSPGDLIMYGWHDSGSGDYSGSPDHVGIVEDCDGKVINIIEGNYCDSVKRRTIAVNARYIRGFCRPDYAAKSEKTLTGFPDVPANAWYEEYVLVAARAGILTGFPDGTYKPDQPVTRAELAAVIARMLDKRQHQ